MSGEMGTRAFRASPAYELVVWDRLGEAERRMLGELAADPSFYGILRPHAGSGRTLRAVDRDTALLLLTLREPAPLPGFARSAEAGAIIDLVTDGVLEVADGERFLSGAAGAALLLSGDVARSTHRLGRLSEAALRYAAALRLRDAHALAPRLYGYNRLPLTPAWTARAPDAHAVLRFLDPPFTDGWHVSTQSGGSWMQWQRTGVRSASRPVSAPSHKLYVSPLPDAVPAAFARVLEAVERLPVGHFKVGGDAAGLLRPDKLVLYFDDPATLVTVADALARALVGIPAQGVPFTAPIDDAGLLSWGMDPPAETRPLSWLPSESWRTWLARELASSLVTDGTAPAPVEPALERLRRRGVDVERWVPASNLWRNPEH